MQKQNKTHFFSFGFHFILVRGVVLGVGYFGGDTKKENSSKKKREREIVSEQMRQIFLPMV